MSNHLVTFREVQRAIEMHNTQVEGYRREIDKLNDKIYEALSELEYTKRSVSDFALGAIKEIIAEAENCCSIEGTVLSRVKKLLRDENEL